MVITSTQWLSVRMTTACSLMIAAVAIGAVLVTQSPGNVAPFFRVSKMRPFRNRFLLKFCSVIGGEAMKRKTNGLSKADRQRKAKLCRPKHPERQMNKHNEINRQKLNYYIPRWT